MNVLQTRAVFDGLLHHTRAEPLATRTDTRALGVGVRRIGSQLAIWYTRSTQRRALSELADDPRRLDDIGLTREAALAESRRWFWQANR